jgi:branched-chain amino acid transport system substrate-binding protein
VNSQFKSIIWIAAIVVIALLAVSFAKDTPSSDKETVKIGLSLPLTGNLAFLGEPAKKAAELALRDAGETKYEYELVFEDDSFDPKRAASTASKLINIDKVLAVISFGSGTGNAINSIAEEAQVAHFALASDPNAAKGEYNFIHWTPAFKEGELLAREIDARGYKSISIVDANHPGTLAVSNAIIGALKKTDVSIVSHDVTNVGDKDFRTIINGIKNANPDIIVLELFSPEAEIFVRQMQELGVNVPVTGAETMEWSSEPELFEGQWFVSDAMVPGFAQKYRDAYGSDPLPGASYTYDLVTLLIQIQEDQDEPIAPVDLPRHISEMGDYDSPVFGTIGIDDEGFFLTEGSVKIIKDGKVVLEE